MILWEYYFWDSIFREIEIRADTKENDESPDDMKDTMITFKNGEDEVEIDLVAQLQQGWPSKVSDKLFLFIFIPDGCINKKEIWKITHCK